MHATICNFILDIAQNSIEADASNVEVAILQTDETITIVVTDDGKGMSEQKLQMALDPFYSEKGKHDLRRFGLGLPFLKQAAEATGGDLSIRSKIGYGTEIVARFLTSHFDAPPFGDLSGAAMILMNFLGNFELTLKRDYNAKSYSICKSCLIEALGDLCDAESLSLGKQFIDSLENELFS